MNLDDALTPADGPELVPTRLPEPVVERVPLYKRAGLWWAISACFISASIFMALVIAWTSYSREHDRATSAGDRIGNLEHQLDTANTRIATANRRLTESNKQASGFAAESSCRARLANEVSDAQAAAVIGIGDVALALLRKDDVQAQKAADRYSAASLVYLDAVKRRGDSVSTCQAKGGG